MFDGRFVNAQCVDKFMLVPQLFHVAVQTPGNHLFAVVLQIKVSFLVGHGGDKVARGSQGHLVGMHCNVHGAPDGNAARLDAVDQELMELTIQIQLGNPQQCQEELCPYCHLQQGKVSAVSDVTHCTYCHSFCKQNVNMA